MQPAPDTILNVNDNEPGRYATTRILHRAGFRVIEAANGTDALRIARNQMPPLMLVDINLPDLSGIEVCRQLKADAATASIMVLQVSATNIALSDRVSSLAAGADSFLIQPVEPEELEAVVRALLRLHASEDALRRALAERELLLKEVNHRVKNSLQLVLSMLSLQGQRFKDAEARGLFATAVARVTAIASIHEQLYQDVNPLAVEMQPYLNGLCAELSRAGITQDGPPHLTAEVDAVRLPTEHGVAVALIVNELVTNSLKHARTPQGDKRITVRMVRQDPQQVRLSVADNGTNDAEASDEQGGLGTSLIRMLARQLNGRIDIERAPGQYAVHITFPLQAVPWRSSY